MNCVNTALPKTCFFFVAWFSVGLVHQDVPCGNIPFQPGIPCGCRDQMSHGTVESLDRKWLNWHQHRERPFVWCFFHTDHSHEFRTAMQANTSRTTETPFYSAMFPATTFRNQNWNTELMWGNTWVRLGYQTASDPKPPCNIMGHELGKRQSSVGKETKKQNVWPQWQIVGHPGPCIMLYPVYTKMCVNTFRH